ncbi:MAG: TerB family tellurite resistance protein [Ignavibacterium sp.]|nr:TerB family tellurite resistance protein [Ignavibacterium sp.]MDW8376020.1 hypothetical protein [Ignavibacteriales bacterium]
MNILQLDKSNYLKGLFIAVKMDGKIHQHEKNILQEVSDKLGFSKDFYEETIRYLFQNDNIKQEVIKFSSKEIALSFIEDVLNIISYDLSANESTKKWLTEIANANGIKPEELNEKISRNSSNNGSNYIALLSII